MQSLRYQTTLSRFWRHVLESGVLGKGQMHVDHAPLVAGSTVKLGRVPGGPELLCAIKNFDIIPLVIEQHRYIDIGGHLRNYDLEPRKPDLTRPDAPEVFSYCRPPIKPRSGDWVKERHVI